MAKERVINTQFWSDEYIEALDPEGKLLYVYTFTNDLANIAGIYEITRKRIHDETGIGYEKIDSLMERFEEDKKVFRFNSWIIVCNMPKHQKWQERPKIKAGIDAILKKLPDKILKHIHTLSIPYTYPSIDLDLDLNSVGDNDLDLIGKQSKKLLDYFFNKFLEKFNEKMVVSGPREMGIFKKLLQTRDENNIMALIDSFFEFKDPWVIKAGYTVGVFNSVINKLIIQNKTGNDENDKPDLARLRAQRLLEENK